MGPLISNLISKVAEAGLEKAVEQSAEKAQVSVFRRILYGYLILVGLGVAIMSTFFWQYDGLPGANGLPQLVQAGEPFWILLVPICSLLMVIVALLPIKGRQTITFILSIGASFLDFGVLADIQVLPHGFNGYAVISVLISLPLPLIAALLVLGDIPSLDSPLAPITWVYFGRLLHLRAWQRFAQARGWQTSGPAGREIALQIQGPLDDRHTAIVTSGIDPAMMFEYTKYFFFRVKITSSHNILPLRINRFALPESLDKKPGVRGMTGKPRVSYYIRTQPGTSLPPGFTDQLEALIAEGRPYLKRLDMVQMATFGILYTRRNWRLRAKDVDANLLQWLLKLTVLMETVSPIPPAPPKP